MNYVPVSIPTNESFLDQWHLWVQSKVSRHFKRDKERISDTAQNVRIRLLSKDFIGRWFFKHLNGEVVDRIQAERILGGAQITFIGQLNPIHGKRSSEDSLWLVLDLLKYAKFDHARYYYSVQNHTIDSAKVLRLLGYPSNAFESLASLYRQGRLKPAELTEHECTGKKSCSGCEHGRSLLKGRKLSLAHRWSDPAVRDQVLKLRWNDSQLIPFLRNWRRSNIVSATPLYVMREPNARGIAQGIDAGLLKYAEKIITNEVVNDFKRMSRTDDISRMIFNNGKSPEFSNDELIAFEGEDGEERPTQILRDVNSMSEYKEFEHRTDIKSAISRADLTVEEKNAILSVELMEMTVRQYSEATGTPVPRIHRVRASAMRKLRGNDIPVDSLVKAACLKHKCQPSDLSSQDLFGPCVLARTEVFSKLYDLGMNIESIADRFDCTESRVVAAINRMTLREMKQQSLTT